MFKTVKQSLITAVGVCIGVFPGLSTPLAGQQFEITPFVGLYLPTSNVMSETATSGSITASIAAKHSTTFMFGGRLTYWVSPQVGVEGSFGYTPSKVTFTASVSGVGAGSADTSAHVMLGSARVLYRVGPKGGNTDIHLLAGVSFVTRGGAAYDLLKQITDSAAAAGTQLSGLSDVGGVVGVALRFKAGPSLDVRVDLEDNLYSTQFEIAGVKTTSKFQNDLVLGLGLAIRL